MWSCATRRPRCLRAQAPMPVRSTTTAGSSKRIAPSTSIPSARSTRPTQRCGRPPARRCRCRAWAITSTPPTCQSSPRAASARSRARPDKASVAAQLPSPATWATAPAAPLPRRHRSIRATFTSIRPSAITSPFCPVTASIRRWPVRAARLKRRPEFSGSLGCPTIAPASTLALATAATPWAARRSPER